MFSASVADPDPEKNNRYDLFLHEKSNFIFLPLFVRPGSGIQILYKDSHNRIRDTKKVVGSGSATLLAALQKSKIPPQWDSENM
jgi:hypothetical protein